MLLPTVVAVAGDRLAPAPPLLLVLSLLDLLAVRHEIVHVPLVFQAHLKIPILEILFSLELIG